MSEPTANPFTPPNASIDAPPQAVSVGALAERGARLAAVLLDFLCVVPAAVLVGVFAYVLGSRSNGAPISPLAFVWAGVGGLYFLGLAIFQTYLLSTRGQTLGKRWMGVKVVKLDGSAPGFVHAVLLRIFVNGLIGGIPKVGAAYSLVDILMIFRDDRRCVHDLIAGTRVVKAT
jgi:uncharacterized RDD family membrane protein YckC